MQLRKALFALVLGFGFSLGVSSGCDKEKKDETESPSDDGGGNLCKEYKTCDECIAGQQKKGAGQGEAETQCGAAVAGCWVTWEKPIVCAGKEKKKDE